MSIFGNILSKVGLRRRPDKEDAPAQATEIQEETPVTPVPEDVSIPVVDVMANLEAMAAANPQKLNWKESIVDLMKLLDLDSSYAARKELATELNCPADKMGDSAQMNKWLHETVLQKLAENGGNIPQDLL